MIRLNTFTIRFCPLDSDRCLRKLMLSKHLLKGHPHKRLIPPLACLFNQTDYDYGAAQAAGVVPDARGHLPDTYKKPNHITFSDKSQYNNGGAGHWENLGNDKWSFAPGPTNLRYHSMDELRDYFKNYKPNSTLLEPKQNTTTPQVQNYINALQGGGTP